MMPRHEQTIGELLHQQALAHGPRPFLLWRDTVRTYAELDEDANRVANALIGLGVTRQDKVAVLLDNCSLYVALFCGIPRAGAVFVPINPRYAEEEMRRVLDHSDAAVLVTAEQYVGSIERMRADLPTLRTVLTVGESAPPGVLPLGERLSQASCAPPDVPVSPRDLAAIIYTSGTTGTPKGVMLTHWNYVANAHQARRCKQMTSADRFLTALPLCHVAPQVGAILAHLCAGASVVLLDKFSPEPFLEAVQQSGATAFGAVPTIYGIFLCLADEKKFDFSALRYCNTSAATMPAELGARVQQEFGASLLESYGLTEGTCGSACNPIDGVRKPCSVGLPLEGQELRIVDEHGRPLPAGEVGEVVIRGPNVMLGYYKDPAATAAVLRDGWLYSGDLGYLDQDGYLFLVGRQKDLIIRGGVNIHPADVEAVIYRHPHVREAVVVGMPDAIWGERVHACLIAKPGAVIEPEEILELCRSALADYKVPTSVSIHADFPRTSTNKVKRPQIVQRLVRGDSAAAAAGRKDKECNASS